MLLAVLCACKSAEQKFLAVPSVSEFPLPMAFLVFAESVWITSLSHKKTRVLENTCTPLHTLMSAIKTICMHVILLYSFGVCLHEMSGVACCIAIQEK